MDLANNTLKGIREINDAFKRVGRHESVDQYKYIPVHKLPENTVIQMDCGDKQYTLIKGKYSQCTLINHTNGATADIRIVTEALAPTSTLQANVILPEGSLDPDTFESPVITRLEIPGCSACVLDSSILPINRPVIATTL